MLRDIRLSLPSAPTSRFPIVLHTPKPDPRTENAVYNVSHPLTQSSFLPYFGISPPLPSPSYRVRLHYTLFMREISLNRKRNNTTGSKYDTTYGTLFQSINFDFRECTTFLGTKVGCFCFLFFHFCEFFLKFLVLL